MAGYENTSYFVNFIVFPIGKLTFPIAKLVQWLLL